MGLLVSGESATHNQSEDTDEPENPLRYFFTCANYCRGTERLPRKHHPDVVEGRRKKEFETDEDVIADAAASPRRKLTAKEKARLERVFAKVDEYRSRMTETPFKALQDAYESALQKMDPASKKRG